MRIEDVINKLMNEQQRVVREGLPDLIFADQVSDDSSRAEAPATEAEDNTESSRPKNSLSSGSQSERVDSADNLLPGDVAGFADTPLVASEVEQPPAANAEQTEVSELPVAELPQREVAEQPTSDLPQRDVSEVPVVQPSQQEVSELPESTTPQRDVSEVPQSQEPTKSNTEIPQGEFVYERVPDVGASSSFSPSETEQPQQASPISQQEISPPSSAAPTQPGDSEAIPSHPGFTPGQVEDPPQARIEQSEKSEIPQSATLLESSGMMDRYLREVQPASFEMTDAAEASQPEPLNVPNLSSSMTPDFFEGPGKSGIPDSVQEKIAQLEANVESFAARGQHDSQPNVNDQIWDAISLSERRW